MPNDPKEGKRPTHPNSEAALQKGRGKFKTSAYERGKKGGAPGIYTPERYDERARKLALLGLKDSDIAMALDIDTALIWTWRKKHPTFNAALQSGRLEADADVVEGLYKRAKGFNFEEEKIFCQNGQVVRANTNRYVMPNVGAAFVWLRNRHRELWGASSVPEEMDRLNEIIELMKNGPALPDATTKTIEAALSEE